MFLECASRLEHVGLNKYFWHIYKVTMTCFTTRHIQRGGGGQHFSTLRAPKLMTHWAPRVFDLLDTPLINIIIICTVPPSVSFTQSITWYIISCTWPSLTTCSHFEVTWSFFSDVFTHVFCTWASHSSEIFVAVKYCSGHM